MASPTRLRPPSAGPPTEPVRRPQSAAARSLPDERDMAAAIAQRNAQLDGLHDKIETIRRDSLGGTGQAKGHSGGGGGGLLPDNLPDYAMEVTPHFRPPAGTSRPVD